MKDSRTKLKTAHRDDVFRITVNVHNAYKKIFKIKTYRKGRVRHVLYSGWTSILSTLVWDKMKLPCCLTWKTGNVRKNDIGHCTVDGCDTTIECVAIQKELSFKIENFDANHFHDPDVKRRILHTEESKYQAMLRGRSAFAVHCELAGQLIDDNESDIETLEDRCSSPAATIFSAPNDNSEQKKCVNRQPHSKKLSEPEKGKEFVM